MDKCKHCDADIIWSRARTSRRWMPLDGIRVGSGVRFIVDEEGTAHTTTVGPGHTLHVSTCVARKKVVEDDNQGELDV